MGSTSSSCPGVVAVVIRGRGRGRGREGREEGLERTGQEKGEEEGRSQAGIRQLLPHRLSKSDLPVPKAGDEKTKQGTKAVGILLTWQQKKE